jgi:hypothetical protein
VFSGQTINQVATIEVRSDAKGESTQIENAPSDLVGWEFVVECFWKGVPTDTVVVFTPRSDELCGYSFADNTSYLVYGDFRDASKAKRFYKLDGFRESAILVTSASTRTRLLDEAASDLDALPEPPCGRW